MISRKQVIETAERVFAEYNVSYGGHHGGFAEAISEAIRNIPTAYDVDKVVERLEEKTELAYKRYIDCDSSTPSPVYIRYATQYEERRECLEIVKAGGLNEN